jgi:hypothetical protein
MANIKKNPQTFQPTIVIQKSTRSILTHTAKRSQNKETSRLPKPQEKIIHKIEDYTANRKHPKSISKSITTGIPKLINTILPRKLSPQNLTQISQ